MGENLLARDSCDEWLQQTADTLGTVLMQFAQLSWRSFADLCESFAFFAVSDKNRKERKSGQRLAKQTAPVSTVQFGSRSNAAGLYSRRNFRLVETSSLGRYRQQLSAS
jgi:hypothetical protein